MILSFKDDILVSIGNSPNLKKGSKKMNKSLFNTQLKIIELQQVYKALNQEVRKGSLKADQKGSQQKK